MMRFPVLKLIVIALLVSACANNEKEAQNSNQDPSLYSMESGEQSQSSDVLFEDSEAASKSEPAQKIESEPVVVENTASDSAPAAPVSPEKMSVYRVQHDRETLMMIAFKIYGDYHRWRDIANMNREMFDERYVIKKGMMLKFVVPESEFKYEPKGEPFVIKWGDTLSSISKEVYDTLNRWREIWHNNRPLISDPNKIFAGFTLYYVPGAKGAVKQLGKAKEVLPDLASTNPNAEEAPASSTAVPEPVDPKVELETLEQEEVSKTQTEQIDQASATTSEAVSDSALPTDDTTATDRNPTSL